MPAAIVVSFHHRVHGANRQTATPSPSSATAPIVRHAVHRLKSSTAIARWSFVLQPQIVQPCVFSSRDVLLLELTSLGADVRTPRKVLAAMDFESVKNSLVLGRVATGE